MASPVLLGADREPKIEYPEPMETDEALYELVNGQRVEMPPMSFYAAKIATRLGAKLSDFAEAHKLGEVVVEGLFRLPVTEDFSRDRRPDVAFVSFDRSAAERPEDLDANAGDVIPDLAIEVTSPTDRAEEQREKVLEYFRVGVRRVWVVYPKLQLIDVYESPSKVQILSATAGDILRGDPVLPGFELPLSKLFEPIGPQKQ
jgi:Uma2 family endonuclease